MAALPCQNSVGLPDGIERDRETFAAKRPDHLLDQTKTKRLGQSAIDTQRKNDSSVRLLSFPLPNLIRLTRKQGFIRAQGDDGGGRPDREVGVFSLEAFHPTAKSGSQEFVARIGRIFTMAETMGPCVGLDLFTVH